LLTYYLMRGHMHNQLLVQYARLSIFPQVDMFEGQK
jgi:hypothetical protein